MASTYLSHHRTTIKFMWLRKLWDPYPHFKMGEGRKFIFSTLTDHGNYKPTNDLVYITILDAIPTSTQNQQWKWITQPNEAMSHWQPDKLFKTYAHFEINFKLILDYRHTELPCCPLQYAFHCYSRGKNAYKSISAI